MADSHMEFLVRMEVQLPHELPADRRTRLREDESVRANALATAGNLLRLWRTPARRANWGLWRASDATALHEAVTSLPLWRYLDVDVFPLARHPNDPAYAVGRGIGPVE